MNKEIMYKEISANLFELPKKTYREQAQELFLENIRIQKINSVIVYTLYKGEKYTTIHSKMNTHVSEIKSSNVHLDASLHPQMDLAIQLLKDLVTIELTLNSYIARALNLSETSKDVDLLLPWANLNILTLPLITPVIVAHFLHTNEKFAHMAKERMLMNLLMK